MCQRKPACTCRAAVAPAASANTSTALCDLPAVKSQRANIHGYITTITIVSRHIKQYHRRAVALYTRTSGLGYIREVSVEYSVESDWPTSCHRRYYTTHNVNKSTSWVASLCTATALCICHTYPTVWHRQYYDKHLTIRRKNASCIFRLCRTHSLRWFAEAA